MAIFTFSPFAVIEVVVETEIEGAIADGGDRGDRTHAGRPETGLQRATPFRQAKTVAACNRFSLVVRYAVPFPPASPFSAAIADGVIAVIAVIARGKKVVASCNHLKRKIAVVADRQRRQIQAERLQARLRAASAEGIKRRRPW